jgi:hypothetical protein
LAKRRDDALSLLRFQWSLGITRSRRFHEWRQSFVVTFTSQSTRDGRVRAENEDKNSGTILLQQARRREMRAYPIESKLTAMGKDERAISVSGYVHRGLVKYTEHAFNKTFVYKRHARNHLLDQIESFRVGDKNSDREDDLLDSFCYGVAIALGNSEGF